jgi:hypothetical protein
MCCRIDPRDTPWTRRRRSSCPLHTSRHCSVSTTMHQRRRHRSCLQARRAATSCQQGSTPSGRRMQPWWKRWCRRHSSSPADSYHCTMQSSAASSCRTCLAPITVTDESGGTEGRRDGGTEGRRDGGFSATYQQGMACRRACWQGCSSQPGTRDTGAGGGTLQRR